ncbi:tail completion protein gp17 [Falsirhodobacter xinxiangensis]|uniref:tail completion protein gp17 n=1 Tax=Falsirhodobacter xinxiangensis TaxID=2530049 RepID=UPI0010AA4FEB|nr:DUF3168 domain-containing protein [Rhodobacter xinxiangensis]
METDLRVLVLALVDVPVNWGKQPAKALIGVVLNTISDVEAPHMRGPDGLSVARVQIDTYADTYARAKEISNAIRTGLNGYRGGRFQGVFLDSVRDSYDTSDTTPLHRASLDFMINYER